MIEVHPFIDYINSESNIKGGYIPANTRIIIIGTFPPQKEYSTKGVGFFFYSSERNHLWNRIDNICADVTNYLPLKKTAGKNYSETFIQNKQRKMDFCDKNQIGFIDVFAKVARRAQGSSSDEDLISFENILENGSLKHVIQSHNVVRICCVYTLAYRELMDNFVKHGFEVKTSACEHSANGLKHNINILDKQFEFVLLYPATRSREKKEIKDSQYKYFLFS